MRTALISGVLIAGLACLPATLSAQAERKLQLSFHTGHVTLLARNVTLREILAEWSRQGGCQFLNADKLTGGVLASLQFDDEPELMVLETLLGPVSGYIVGGRRIGTLGASQFEAVYIIPTSHPTAANTFGTAPVAAPLVNSMPDDEIPPVVPITNLPNGGRAGAPNPNSPSPYPNSPSGPGSTVGAPGAVPPIGGRAGAPGSPVPGTGTGRGGGGGV